MIVKPPKNEYEKQIYYICIDIPKLPEGEKAIIYDLAVHDIPHFAEVDFSLIDLNDYIQDIIIIYNKYKSSPVINLVTAFINRFDFKEKKKKEATNNANKNITSQQRYWIGEFD